MFSKSVAVLPATLSDRTFVIAAVRVVLPWSTCPIVPILQCGLVLSNLAFAILNVLLKNSFSQHLLVKFGLITTKVDYISKLLVFQAFFDIALYIFSALRQLLTKVCGWLTVL